MLFLSLFTFVFFPLMTVEAKDTSSDYNTYVEIVMTTGKLLKNYTKLEYDKAIADGVGIYFNKIKVCPVNKNVEATYISNTLFSVENRSATDVKYEVDITLEKNNKVTFTAGGSLSASASGTIKKIKVSASNDANVNYSDTTTTSIKEKKSMTIIVEANSRAIIYLTGDLSVTNGVILVYRCFFLAYKGGYEIVVLKSQYARIEKVSI